MRPEAISLPDRLSQDVAEKAVRATHLLHEAARDYAPITFANSLGAEDMVLTDLIWSNHIDITMFTLDTGRLPAEVYDLIRTVEQKYSRRMEIFFPECGAVEACVAEHGINGFYDSIEARKACCQVRKVEPLKRALNGKNAWVTGLRAAQSPTREKLKPVAFDQTFSLVKISPLADWSEKDVWAYLRVRQVPYNVLHDRGFPSIGCGPCTRAI